MQTCTENVIIYGARMPAHYSNRKWSNCFDLFAICWNNAWNAADQCWVLAHCRCYIKSYLIINYTAGGFGTSRKFNRVTDSLAVYTKCACTCATHCGCVCVYLYGHYV